MIGQAVSLAAVVWSVALMMNRKTNGAASDRPLSAGERVQVVIICLFAPIISGLIFYFGWRESLPRMARQAGVLAAIIFLIELMLGFALGYSIYFAS